MVKKKRKSRFSQALAFLLALTLAIPTMLGALPLAAQADESYNLAQDDAYGGGFSEEHLSLKAALDEVAATQTEDDTILSPLSTSYTVNFFMPGENEPLRSPTLEVAENTPLTSLLPENPTKEGFGFVGWRDRDLAGSEAMTAGVLAALTVTKDLNLEAVFAQNYTITFQVGDTVHATQTLAQGQLATLPETPVLPEGKSSFTGWFIDSGCTIEFDFSTVITAPLTLYAGFSDKFLVMFKNADGEVYESQPVAGGATAVWPNENPASPNENESFMYWYIEGDETETRFNFLDTLITANLVLIPKFGSTHYVFFNSQGSVVESPVAVEDGGTLSEPTGFTRAGYDFAFWSVDSTATYTDTGKAYDFSSPVTANFTLTGIWKPKDTVAYTIAFWMEKADYNGTPDPANPADYAYVGSLTRADGTPGETTTVQGSDSDVNTLFTGGHAMLKYAEFQTAENKVVKGDGSTVVNVYATRKVYTYTYDIGSVDDWNTPERSMTMADGARYTNDRNAPRLTVPVKYGQDVTNLLPWVGNINATFHSNSWALVPFTFAGWETDGNMSSNGTLVSRRNVIDAGMLSANGQVRNYMLTADWQTFDIDKRYLYMVEPLTGTGGNTNPANGAVWIDGYVELNEYRQSLGGDLIDWVFGNTLGAKEIYGYDRRDGDPVSRWYFEGSWYGGNPFHFFWDSLNYLRFEIDAVRYYVFFYERNTHELGFELLAPEGVTVTNPPVSQTISFGTSLAAYEPAELVYQGADDYTFGGWYTNADYYEEFNFATTMSDSDVKAYARWIPKEITAVYYSKPGGEEVDTQDYARGATLSLSTEYEVGVFYDGLGEFSGWGWFLPNSDALQVLGSEFTINNSMNIYGLWKTDNFKLTYDSNGGEGDVPTDDALYKLNVLAPVAGAVLERDSNEVFVGWQVAGEGSVYYPGSHVAMQGDITLVALYANQSALVTLTYNANYGDSPALIEQDVVRGQEFMPLGNDAFTRNGYVLVGWSDTLGGTTVDYEFGEAMTINTNTTLYAVWEKEETFTVEFKIADGQEGWGMLDGTTRYEEVKKGSHFGELISAEGWPVATATEGYRFKGWEPATPPNMYVNDNWTFTAIFVPQATVTFVAGEGVAFEGIESGEVTFTLDEGTDWNDAVEEDLIEVPTATAEQYYTLGDWDKLLPTVITGNETYTYTATRDQVMVTFTPIGWQYAWSGESDHFALDAGTTWGENFGSEPGKWTIPQPQPWHLGYVSGDWVGSTALYPDGEPLPTGIPGSDFVVEEDMFFEVRAELLDVVVTTESDTQVYDGSALTNVGYTTSGLPEGYGLTAVLDGAQTDAGSSENTVASYIVTNEEGDDVTRYFDGSVVDGFEAEEAVRVEPGTLTVTPRPVTITVNSFTKTVGAADPVFTAQITNLIEGDSLSYTLEREPGEAVGTYEIYMGPMVGIPNYSITSTNGTLTITAAPVVPVVPVVPVAPAGPVAPVAPVDPVAPATVIPDEETPLAGPETDAAETTPTETVIEEEEAPLAQANQGYWALWNLILALITLAITLAMLIGYFVSKKKESTPLQTIGRASASEQAEARGFRLDVILRFLSLVPTAAAITVFVLTQNISSPMQMFDNWTVLMAVIAIIQTALAFFVAAKRNNPGDRGINQTQTQVS